MRQFVLILIVGIVVYCGVHSEEPCATTNFLNDWHRSATFSTEALPICDNFLVKGWYRVTSGAGDRMPTECPVGGFRCNTFQPIYLSRDGLANGEDVYPADNITVTRIAYAASYNGNCKHRTYTIQIKNCGGYFVYYLVPISGGCSSAYCFGDQVPCAAGMRSETGFTPGCASKYYVDDVNVFMLQCLCEHLSLFVYDNMD